MFESQTLSTVAADSLSVGGSTASFTSTYIGAYLSPLLTTLENPPSPFSSCPYTYDT